MDTKTDTNPPILCVRCGGAGANVYGGGVWSHHFWRDCIEHLTARVEAAEALAAERAANTWRPVTEKPAEPGRYLVWCPSPWPGYEIAPYDRGWWGFVDLRFTHWQPLPPAPDAQEPTP